MIARTQDALLQVIPLVLTWVAFVVALFVIWGFTWTVPIGGFLPAWAGISEEARGRIGLFGVSWLLLSSAWVALLAGRATRQRPQGNRGASLIRIGLVAFVTCLLSVPVWATVDLALLRLTDAASRGPFIWVVYIAGAIGLVTAVVGMGLSRVRQHEPASGADRPSSGQA
jgi:hypothetical protein